LKRELTKKRVEMFYPESERIMISALQHYLFCPRQCALIHLEQVWQENYLTASGRQLHDKAHEGIREKRGDKLEVRGLRISSAEFGLSGQTDVVEFHQSESGVQISGRRGQWQPFPVEYKRGKPKQDNSDVVQLCAQAFCLEEMLNTNISKGAIYYGKNRRRFEVQFDQLLRDSTIATIKAVHQLFASGQTPKAGYEKKCDSCSLLTICLPKKLSVRPLVSTYMKRMVE
jgi:CRISPR-associated exonuclease Cas4